MNILATKYAQAFLSVYEKRISLGDIQNIQKCLDVFKTIPRIKTLLKLSFKESVKETKLLEFMQPYQISLLIRPMIVLLKKKNRLYLIIDVLEAIVDHYYLENNYLTFSIMSSQKLHADQCEIIMQFLKKMTGKKIIAQYKLNQEMIVGMKFLSNEYLWQDSIKYRLDNVIMKLNTQGAL